MSYIPHDQNPPEITIKATIFGILLAAILSISTCYLGLKIGRTIAASIPSAILAMSIFRLFKTNNILENNMAQTIASAGEAVAAGAIFTLPALVIVGFWSYFHYYETTFIVLLGGLLGVLFSIPLRRALLVEKKLPYPEGLVTAEVLKLGDGDASLGTDKLIIGAIISFFTILGQTGFKIISEGFTKWVAIGHTAFGFGIGFSPILLAAGYIIGIQICLLMLIGTIITWVIGIPLYGILYGLPVEDSVLSSVREIYESYFRYVGIGAIAVAGIWSIFSVFPTVIKAIHVSRIATRAAEKKAALEASKMSNETQENKQKEHKSFFQLISTCILPFKVTHIKRTERDVPMSVVLPLICIIGVLLFFAIKKVIFRFGLHELAHLPIILIITLFVILIGFVCAGIASYLSGILGTTSLPTSGITLTAIFIISIPFLYLLPAQLVTQSDFVDAMEVASLTLMFAAFIAIGVAISGDNMQDLRAGYEVGSTPWKQQIMLMLGVFVSAIVIAPTLNLLLDVYGMGEILPKVAQDTVIDITNDVDDVNDDNDADGTVLATDTTPSNIVSNQQINISTMLAPQATLMAAVAKGLFLHQLKWTMIMLGGVIAILFILLDLIFVLFKVRFRFPIMVIATGMYLPLEYVVAFCVGGIVAYFAKSKLKSSCEKLSEDIGETAWHSGRRGGLLFASGVIAGEALTGMLLAIPFALYGRDDVLSISIKNDLFDVPLILGALAIFTIIIFLYRAGSKTKYH